LAAWQGIAPDQFSGLPIFVSAGFSETVWAFDFCAIGSGGAL